MVPCLFKLALGLMKNPGISKANREESFEASATEMPGLATSIAFSLTLWKGVASSELLERAEWEPPELLTQYTFALQAADMRRVSELVWLIGCHLVCLVAPKPGQIKTDRTRTRQTKDRYQSRRSRDRAQDKIIT